MGKLQVLPSILRESVHLPDMDPLVMPLPGH